MKEKKVKDLDSIIASINKREGTNIITQGLPKRDYERIPFTSPRMNYCTYGGLPRGKIIEFSGEEHGGKSTTALDIVANFQQLESVKEKPLKVVYADTENAVDTIWAEKLGVDTSAVKWMQPEGQSAETILQDIIDMVSTGEVGLVVVDSIASMLSEDALEKDVGDKTYAGISMPLTKFATEMEMLCKKTNCTLIGINQIRDNIGGYGPSTKTPGGRAWKHLCMVRMEFSRGSFINEKGDEIKRSSESPAGNKVLMSMTKNKTCPSNRRGGFYTINYAFGIDYLADLIEVAIKYDLVQQSGAWFTIVDPDTGELKSEKIQGQANVYEYLKDENNEDALTFIENYIDSKIG